MINWRLKKDALLRQGVLFSLILFFIIHFKGIFFGDFTDWGSQYPVLSNALILRI